MLRVLTLSTIFPNASDPNGGGFVERQVLGLATRDGVEIRVIAPVRLPSAPIDRLPRYRLLTGLPLEEQWRGVHVYRPRFRVPPRVAEPCAAWSLTRELAPLLRRIRRDFAFDVIAAEFFWPDGVAAVRLGKIFAVPVSIKARGSDIDAFGQRRSIRPQIVDASRGAAALLSVSEALKGRMIALGMPAERIAVHYTGLDRTLFDVSDRRSAKAALGLAGPVIATLGRLVPFKGQRLALAALEQIGDATLLVIGKGPDRAALEAIAEKSGLKTRVRFLGDRSRHEIPALIAAADVMLFPSEREGLANAWLEALACGRPIVVADTAAAYEVLGGRDAGRVVPRKAEALAEAVLELLARPPDPASVRASTAPFSWKRNGDELFRHLSRVAGTGGATPAAGAPGGEAAEDRRAGTARGSC